MSGRWRLATVDIDGTLTRVPGWQMISARFGKEPEYRQLIRRHNAGEVGLDDALRGLLGFAEGHTVPEVEAVLETTPRLAHIPEGVARLHREGLVVALLTHNPPYVTAWYRRVMGFDDAAGLAGHQESEPRIGRSTDVRGAKVEGLADLCARWGVPPERAVHVGDAPADIPVFRQVGRGIALNPGRPEVEKAADVVLRTDDFERVVDEILRPGSPR